MLVGGLFVFGLLKLSLERQLHYQEQVYGQALANNAARDAIDAMFRSDLLQLQTMLQNVVQNPGIVSASVHSVENKVLVQAGTQAVLSENHRTFEAAITLPDSVAGFVSLQVKTYENQQAQVLFFLFILTGAAWIAWKLYNDKNIEFIKTNPANTEPYEDLEAEHEEAEEERYDEPAAVSINACLAVCVKNAEVLKQQLSGPAYRECIAEFERKIKNIGALYGAIDCKAGSDRYFLLFHSEDRDEAIFSAVCSGRVILDLAAINKRVPLDLSAQVSSDSAELENISMPFVGLAVSRSEAISAAIHEKVELIEISQEEQNRLLVSGFEASYEALLQKQMAQFKQHSL